jgi:hypothetical protein
MGVRGSVRVESESNGTIDRQTVSREKLVAEVWDSSGTKRKRNVSLWKPLPSSTVKTMTETTSLCVIVIRKSVVTNCVINMSSKSNYHSKPRL